MALEHIFRLVSETLLDEVDGKLYLRKQAPSAVFPFLKIPADLEDPVKDLKHHYVSSDELEQLFTKNASAKELPIRYYLLETLRKYGFLTERVSVAGRDLIEITPAVYGPSVPFDHQSHCILSRFAYIHRQEDRLVLESPKSSYKITFLDRETTLLATFPTEWTSLTQMTSRLSGMDARAVIELVEVFSKCGFLVLDKGADPSDEDAPPLALWEFHDLLFHARSRTGRHGYPSGGTYHFLDKIPQLPLVKTAMSDKITPLKAADVDRLELEDKPFTAVLEERASIRDYSDKPVTVEELGELLYRSARIKYIQKDDRKGDLAFRPFPGGGAIHELEIYPLVQHCDGLDKGLYHYNSLEHHLEKLCDMGHEQEAMLWQAASAQGRVDTGRSIQILFLITSRLPRVSWKYQSIAYSISLKNLGCLLQTFYLVATAMDLGPCAIGSGDSELFAKISGIDYYDEPLIGEFVIGRPRE